MQPNQLNRAKLFLSYDSLKGFKERIHAKERIVVEKPKLSEDQLYELDWKIKQIKTGMMISVLYFDRNEYVYKEGVVTKIKFNNLKNEITIVNICIPLKNIVYIDILSMIK